MGCLKKNQIKKALIQAGIDAVDVVQAFDEMDRNGDNLITYEEFRYYVNHIMGNDNAVYDTHHGPGFRMTELQKWMDYWPENYTAEGPGREKISKDEAIAAMKEYAKEPMSPGLVRALQNQMDINGDGLIDFYEFARASEKVLDPPNQD